MGWKNFTREDILDAIIDSKVEVPSYTDKRTLPHDRLVKLIKAQPPEIIDRIKNELNKGAE